MGRRKKIRFTPNKPNHNILWLIKKLILVFCEVFVLVGWITVWLILLPFRIIKYLLHYRWGRRFLVGWAIVITIYIILLGLQKYFQAHQALAQSQQEVLVLKQQLEMEKEKNIALEDKLNTSLQDRGRHVSEAGKAYITKLVQQIFGAQADTALKVFRCESGLSPFNINDKNKPGLGIDGGVAQINERWHKERFEKMYGVPYEVGIFDPELNLKYAKYVQEHSGWTAWVCAKIVGAGK